MKRLILAILLCYSSLAYGADHVIYIVTHEFHSGIIFSKSDISLDYLSNADFYDDAGYIEIGFGDKEYYMKEDPGVVTGARALLLPTQSVLLVVKFSLPPQTTFPKGRIYELSITHDQLQRMLNYVKNAFLVKDNIISSIGGSLYLEGGFYHGKESFHLFNTCNTWAAKVLKNAGLDVRSSLVITQQSLVRQLELIKGDSAL